MSDLSDRTIEFEDLRTSLKELLKETGALVRGCDIHEALVDAGDPEALERACRLAKRRISTPAGWSEQGVADFIKRIVDEAPDRCPDCEHWASKD